MILKVFLAGVLVAAPAVILEMGIFKLFGGLGLGQRPTDILDVFLGVALVEELIKFLAVWLLAVKNREFDEPVDAMIYMITVAMGFAAIENVLILFQLGPAFFWDKTLEISIFRFLGATFLHALASGLIGYFLARSLCAKDKWNFVLIAGIAIATLLHGLYNFSIMKLEGNLKFLIPFLLLLGLAIFISFGFKQLPKLKSICKI